MHVCVLVWYIILIAIQVRHILVYVTLFSHNVFFIYLLFVINCAKFRSWS